MGKCEQFVYDTENTDLGEAGDPDHDMDLEEDEISAKKTKAVRKNRVRLKRFNDELSDTSSKGKARKVSNCSHSRSSGWLDSALCQV